MSSIFCRLYCPLKTTNFCSSVLLIFGAHIIHIDEGERKLAISITKHNFLPSPFTILRPHNSIISFLFLFIVSPYPPFHLYFSSSPFSCFTKTISTLHRSHVTPTTRMRRRRKTVQMRRNQDVGEQQKQGGGKRGKRQKGGGAGGAGRIVEMWWRSKGEKLIKETYEGERDSYRVVFSARNSYSPRISEPKLEWLVVCNGQ